MEDWCINRIQTKKRGNMEIYENVLLKLFNKKLNWNQVKELNKDNLRKLMVTLERDIKIENSKLDIHKLAKAIQTSRSGAGGSAMTSYECKFCGSEAVWVNTAVPNICLDCATQMAENMVAFELDIFKEIKA
ncbi:hypothetical protein NSS71_08155 [Niallia sp. FSL W8-0951]|uniref:hypothetical protein n=1 Tax=Niallia sp. FSL W8-0951 TaxID=2954639 RepID=UPI0030FB5E96